MEKKLKIGYTQGVFDMFHVGHLNLLNNAKAQCDYLIVGVNSDTLVEAYKQKTPVVGEAFRKVIVENIKAVDEAHIVGTLDKLEILKEIPFDVIFIGDDWKGSARWSATQESLKERGVDVVFLPYTQNVSSTLLRTKQEEKVDG
nr:adenylyltransferase/cytidyltransferase family protein [Oscillospiraceae bacterium]